MSILIKGMGIPKNCDSCPLITDGKDYQICFVNKEFIPWRWADEHSCEQIHDRPSWCPLIELPPHGDLIDRDALIKDGWLSLHKQVMRMGGYAIHELPLINPTIPVVIEKENC